jgi:RNA polymerase sigma factor (TIGR02999 family)
MNKSHNVTQILNQVEEGDPTAAEQLLPLVYQELRNLAGRKLAAERKDHTLQGTALVHEAYVRLVGAPNNVSWNSRSHFFAAAAEAMRRILVEHARSKKRLKYGGEHERRDVELDVLCAPEKQKELLAVDEALESLQVRKAVAADLVKLRYFAGFTNEEAAEVLGISARKAYQLWAYAKSFLLTEIENH